MSKDNFVMGRGKFNYLNKVIRFAYSKNVTTLKEFEDLILHIRQQQLQKVQDTREKRKSTKKIVYENYIKSKAWFSFRRDYILKYGRNCQLCEIKTGKHLHHMTYKRLGKEKETDVLFLCEDCHFRIHYGEKGIKTTKTKEMTVNLYWLRDQLGFHIQSTHEVVRTNLSMRL